MRKNKIKTIPKQGPLKSGLKYAWAYFIESNERRSALLYLMGAILGVVGLVILSSVWAWWMSGFWFAITEMSLPLYIESMKTFLVLITSTVGLSVFKDYLVDSLEIRWRKWLSDKLISKYTSAGNYVDLGRHSSEIENPGQRIQDDVHSFVKQSLSLSMDLLQSTLIPATFIGTLWSAGGAFSFVLLGASITIPG